MVKAEYRSAFMVFVALIGNRKKRSTLITGMAEGYELRLSNDGIEFSDPVSILIYDEECYDCNASSISCVFVASCPDYTKDGMATDKTTTPKDTTPKDEDELISYIGPIIIGGSVLLLVVIFCVIVLIKLIYRTSKPKNKRITQFDSWNINTSGTPEGSIETEVDHISEIFHESIRDHLYRV
ncbi:uncharacterized protein [Mytilus edulis]|uniref:uncharacterized protein n=1 Tax=Mytilus edulis TaxID=6550 RepID=UPI0039EE3906